MYCGRPREKRSRYIDACRRMRVIDFTSEAHNFPDETRAPGHSRNIGHEAACSFQFTELLSHQIRS